MTKTLNKTTKRAILLFGGLLIVLFGINALVMHKEHIIENGTRVYLKLAPVDPRSLIQGDYMRLDYAIARQLQQSAQASISGNLVLTLDSQGIASLQRIHDDRRPLTSNEHLLRFKKRNGNFQIGSDAYYFQEGQAKHFEKAAYGEFRVSPSGTSVLVGLADKNLALIKPQKE